MAQDKQIDCARSSKVAFFSTPASSPWNVNFNPNEESGRRFLRPHRSPPIPPPRGGGMGGGKGGGPTQDLQLS